MPGSVMPQYSGLKAMECSRSPVSRRTILSLGTEDRRRAASANSMSSRCGSMMANGWPNLMNCRIRLNGSIISNVSRQNTT